MKWFKHSSTASQDAKLKKLRIKYGMEGYGLYWYCVELIASEVDVNKLTFELEHDSEVLAHDTGIHYERVEEMMRHMVRLGLFQSDNQQITCMQLAKRADEYLTKVLRRAGKLDCLDSVRTKSEQSTDKVRLEERRAEEKKGDNKKTTPAKADFSAFDNAVTQWNEFANEVGLPKVSKITTNRGRKIDTAYKNYKKLRTELNDGNPEPKRMLAKAEFVEALIMVARKQITDFHINMPITFDYLLDKKRCDPITETGDFK